VSQRRILKARRAEAGFASLEVAEEAFTDPGHGEVAVRVAANVLNPSSDAPEGTFSGVISGVGAAVPEGMLPGRVVVGIGPPADLISLPSSEVWCLPSESDLSPEHAAAIPYLCSFLQALGSIGVEPEDRILISGRPAIRHLGESFLKDLVRDASAIETNLPSSHGNGNEPDRDFDVLVHEVADPEDLQLSLSALRENGRAILLVPPGPHVMAFDFYPLVHRHCLRLFPRRVGNPCHPESCPDSGHSALLRLLEQEGIDLDPLLSRASASPGVADLSLEELDGSERLLAVTWS
jgi:hypothetical protein